MTNRRARRAIRERAQWRELKRRRPPFVLPVTHVTLLYDDKDPEQVALAEQFMLEANEEQA